MNYRWKPFLDWYGFFQYELIDCRPRGKKTHWHRDVTVDRDSYRCRCYLTHKNYEKEECYAIADRYIEQALENPEMWNKLFDRHEKYYKKLL